MHDVTQGIPFDKVRLLEIEPLVENHILSSFQNVADEKILCIPLDMSSGEGPYLESDMSHDDHFTLANDCITYGKMQIIFRHISSNEDSHFEHRISLCDLVTSGYDYETDYNILNTPPDMPFVNDIPLELEIILIYFSHCYGHTQFYSNNFPAMFANHDLGYVHSCTRKYPEPTFIYQTRFWSCSNM